jgi:hypothetical protein
VAVPAATVEGVEVILGPSDGCGVSKRNREEIDKKHTNKSNTC